MVVGVCRITLRLPESHSLKEKRMVLRRIKDRVRQKFNAAIAEVGDNDVWQSAQIGFAVVANDRRFVESVVEHVVAFVEAMGVATVTDDEKDVLVYGEEGMSGYDHWEPRG